MCTCAYVDTIRQRAAELPQVTGAAESEGENKEEARTASRELITCSTASPRDQRCHGDDAAASSTHVTGSDAAPAAGPGVYGTADCRHERRYSDGRRHAPGHDGNVATLFSG